MRRCDRLRTIPDRAPHRSGTVVRGAHPPPRGGAQPDPRGEGRPPASDRRNDARDLLTEARRLLDAIDRSTLMGKRDAAVIIACLAFAVPLPSSSAAIRCAFSATRSASEDRWHAGGVACEDGTGVGTDAGLDRSDHPRRMESPPPEPRVLLRLRQVARGRAVKAHPGGAESRPVARTVPGRLAWVPPNDAPHVRAHRRQRCQFPLLILVHRQFR